MELFDRNKKTIKDIYDDFNAGKLIIDSTYQRRNVWLPQDNIRLIETILLGYIVPEVFFWPASVDSETGNSITHIVDGQQRINAIIDYIDGKYKLISKYLLNEEIQEQCGNKSFAELPAEAKTQIWLYKLSVVDIDKSWSKEQIMTMFYRLNLTEYSLNEQERRNSKSSAFGEKAELLTKVDFWSKMKVFSSNDARRMKDTEYCCSVFILAQEGVVDQTNSQKINQYYDDHASEFDVDDKLLNKIEMAMELIEKFADATTTSFISKKAQMYTMFCIAFRLIDEGIEYSETLFIKIKLFISAYNLFRNEYDLSFEDSNLTSFYETIKKYKLASSEGINKYHNRVIRYEQLYKACVVSDDSIIDTMKEMIKILENQKEKLLTMHEEIETESDS